MSIFEMISRFEFFLFDQESINWMSDKLMTHASTISISFQNQSKPENSTEPLKLVSYVRHHAP